MGHQHHCHRAAHTFSDTSEDCEQCRSNATRFSHLLNKGMAPTFTADVKRGNEAKETALGKRDQSIPSNSPKGATVMATLKMPIDSYR